MDELALLEQHRPASLRPTPMERATAKESLMLTIDQPPTDDRLVELAPRRPRRRRYLVAVAAVVAVLALVGTVAFDGGDSGPLATPPAAAAELHRLADLAAATPDVAAPYRQQSRFESTMFGDDGEPLAPFVQDSTQWVLGDGNYATDLSSCMDGDDALRGCVSLLPPEAVPWLPFDGSIADVRAAIDRQTEWMMVDSQLTRSQAAFWVLNDALQLSKSSSAVRAELMRLVAELEGITSTEGVTTALGAVGTRFTAEMPRGKVEMVVDPDDGFLLESYVLIGSDALSGPASLNESRISHARPETVAELPPVIATARDHVIARAAELEAAFVPSAASPASGPWCANDVVTLPEGGETSELRTVAITHCWRPGS